MGQGGSPISASPPIVAEPMCGLQGASRGWRGRRRQKREVCETSVLCKKVAPVGLQSNERCARTLALPCFAPASAGAPSGCGLLISHCHSVPPRVCATAEGTACPSPAAASHLRQLSQY